IQQGIQDETDIKRLKDFWLKEIAKSKLETSDKAKLNELREEHIRELEQSQPGSNDFNQIKNGILTLNIQRSERLKTLSNEQYDSVDKEIPKIDNASPLNDGRTIDNKIRKLKNKNPSSNRDVDTLQQKRRERLYSIATNINNLNQTLLDEDHNINDIITLRKKRYNTLLYDVIEKEIELQYYFVDKNNKQFHSICEIEDVDEFTKNIIKRHYLYKTIRYIFDQEDDINNYSKIVEPNDNERTFFKKIRPLVKDQKYLNKIDKILGKDDLDLPENKKQRKLKNIKEDVNIIIPKTRPIFFKQGYQYVDLTICVNELLKLYKALVPSTDKEINTLRSLLLNNIIKYPDSSIFNKYDIKTEQTNNFFINAQTITKQHFLDIVFKILIKRDEDSRLDAKIGNIFDELEV
ncbi:13310_t:CDS:2, partial [Cetraspora pellucida]